MTCCCWAICSGTDLVHMRFPSPYGHRVGLWPQQVGIAEPPAARHHSARPPSCLSLVSPPLRRRRARLHSQLHRCNHRTTGCQPHACWHHVYPPCILLHGVPLRILPALPSALGASLPLALTPSHRPVRAREPQPSEPEPTAAPRQLAPLTGLAASVCWARWLGRVIAARGSNWGWK